MMTMIRVLAIQKGPYRSGLSPITSLKAGLRIIADLMRANISSSSISKYSLDSYRSTLRENKRKNQLIFIFSLAQVILIIDFQLGM